MLAPALFSERLLNADVLLHALAGVLAFCWLSSAMYIVNDVRDRAADAAHPRKRRRPVASGRVSPPAAIALAVGLATLAGVWAAGTLPAPFLVYLAAYALNTTLYIVWLKYRVIVDVVMIAGGFVIRLLAGCAAVQVEPSPWLLACGFSLALVLGFGKRLAEVEAPGVTAAHRETLQAYTREKLMMVLSVCTAVCLMSYILYTLAPDTVALHGTRNLMYTVPFVVYGTFRYMFRSMESRADGPTDLLTGDPTFLLCGLGWGAAVLAVLAWK